MGATNNVIKEGKGFCDDANKLNPWMEKFFTEHSTPHLVICLSGFESSCKQGAFSNEFDKLNDKLQDQLKAMREKTDESEVWERYKPYVNTRLWVGLGGKNGYRKKNSDKWDVERDLQWKSQNMEKWGVEEQKMGTGILKDKFVFEYIMNEKKKEEYLRDLNNAIKDPNWGNTTFQAEWKKNNSFK